MSKVCHMVAIECTHSEKPGHCDSTAGNFMFSVQSARESAYAVKAPLLMENAIALRMRLFVLEQE